MQDRIRIVGIIIQNNHLLLVKGEDKYKEFWTTGGTNKEWETHLQTLERELLEEVNLKLISADFFWEYTEKAPYTVQERISRSFVYIAQVEWTIKVSHEIKSFVRMSREEFEAGKYPLLPATKNEIIPDLIKKWFFI